MNIGRIEHVNVTVTDPEQTAQRLCGLFGWHVRWRGPAKDGGYTVHVGTKDEYLALYTNAAVPGQPAAEPEHRAGLNHIGIVLDDLDAAEQRIKAAGYRTFSHGDYPPGRRFYFEDEDGIEFEVVAYG